MYFYVIFEFWCFIAFPYGFPKLNDRMKWKKFKDFLKRFADFPHGFPKRMMG